MKKYHIHTTVVVSDSEGNSHTIKECQEEVTAPSAQSAAYLAVGDLQNHAFSDPEMENW